MAAPTRLTTKTVVVNGRVRTSSGAKLWDAYCPEVPPKARKELFVRYADDCSSTSITFSFDGGVPSDGPQTEA